jgi:pimeloyl-ACP methyl ester carboxylesterase
MAMMVKAAGVELAVSVSGEGPGVLLLHDMASDALATAQAPGLVALGGLARVVSYDRRGYGPSTAPEPYEATTIEEQAEDAAAVLEATGAAPALLVGVGFGALIALDLLKRHRRLCSGAVLVDPPLFAFVPEATERLATERAMLAERLRAEGPAAAVAAWLGDDVDPDDRDRALAAHRAFFADLAGLSSWPVTRRELRAMDLPAVVVTRPGVAAHVLAAADAVASLLPAARRATDGDAGGAAAELLGP